ncbi:MAG: HAMP domain-containing sensor histidine kinase [Clostridium sp.]
MKKSFRVKAAIIIIGTVLIGNIILSIATYQFINNKIENDIVQDMEDSKRVAQNSLVINDSGDYTSIVKSIYLINRSYTSMYKNEKEEVSFGGIHNDLKIKEIVEESEDKKSILKLNKEGDKYISTFSYPLYNENEYVSTLIIQSNYGELYKENMGLFYMIVCFQAFIIIALSYIIWVVLGKITKPIVNVAESMRRFGVGEKIEDLEVKGKDEISVITSSFNNMKNEIIKEKEMSREFFNNATHELKTPVTAISGYSQLLIEEGDNGDKEFKKRALARMALESKKLNRLIKNILEVSRGNSVIKEEKKIIGINKVIEKITEDLEVRMNKSNIRIEKSLELIEVESTESDIELLLLNLIDNSLKYSKGNVISIETNKSEDTSKFIIENEIGYIPQDLANRLFEPFIKVSDDKELNEKTMTSSGLGLYICQEICRRNGWEIYYDINENKIKFSINFK